MPGEHVGSGRIKTSDERWQEEILPLVHKASRIFMIPSHHEGTLWEMSKICEFKYLSKTIFIMPPDIPFNGSSFSLEWQKTVDAVQRISIELPHYFPKGLIFNLDENGKLHEFEPFNFESLPIQYQSYSTLNSIVEFITSEIRDNLSDEKSGEETNTSISGASNIHSSTLVVPEAVQAFYHKDCLDICQNLNVLDSGVLETSPELIADNEVGNYSDFSDVASNDSDFFSSSNNDSSD